MTSEKELPLHVGDGASRTRKLKRAHHFGVLAVLLLTLLVWCLSYRDSTPIHLAFTDPHHEPDALCPIVPKIDPTKHLANPDTLKYILTNKKFHKRARKNLAGAVRIPTQVYDDMENPTSAKSLHELYQIEPRWKTFESSTSTCTTRTRWCTSTCM
ncbi:hypothetical protein Cantr_07260 [Candida viswanathii]|uniref:Uncharacterized protein n=1 Tax=Candida viswanathii TaxID=5486 RepID=A0A367Y316_9ASCO|nr:hypothetical protein Cantr_07260 [Candida viswanathii]